MALFNVNKNDLPASQSYGPIPEGWYSVEITDADLANTKDGSGQYIKLKMTVTGPSYEGRVVFCNLNVINRSARAEEIGRAQLRSIMDAIGLQAMSDTDQLIGGRMLAKLAVRPETPEYPASNDVRGFKPIQGNANASGIASAQRQPQQTAPAASPATRPAAATPPWKQ